MCTDKEARVVGYVYVAQNEDPLQLVLAEFQQYLDIMRKEATDVLPKHRPYNCKIDLKEGSVAPWGPIYPLSETEL